jgi:hypothetical protein
MFADNALLVSLNISQWTARKLDKGATKEVAATHGVNSSVGNYNKAILPGATALDNIKKATGAARTYYYKATLPWAMEGAGILPNKNYIQFTTDMRQLKADWEHAVEQFLCEYQTLKANAQQQLNGLYNESDYPADPSSLFKFDISFMPVPQSSDFRITLASEELAKFEGQLVSAEQDAIKEIWKRMYEVASKAVERLRDPDGVFRDSLVDNAKELCDMLPRLNFNDDPEMSAMCYEIEQSLALKSPEALRTIPTTRKETVESLEAVMSKMAGLFN